MFDSLVSDKKKSFTNKFNDSFVDLLFEIRKGTAKNTRIRFLGNLPFPFYLYRLEASIAELLNQQSHCKQLI